MQGKLRIEELLKDLTDIYRIVAEFIIIK